MRLRHIIPFVIILGFLVLYFFPEPETNFFWYAGTGLMLVIAVIFLILFDRRAKQ